MNRVEESLPTPQALCYVSTIPHMRREEPFTFVLCSDGDFYWDNLIDEILQKDEVLAWRYCNEQNIFTR